MINEVTLFSNTVTGWQRPLYAFLAEKEQRSVPAALSKAIPECCKTFSAVSK